MLIFTASDSKSLYCEKFKKMKLRLARHNLEEYFSKKYPEKYTELGGYYYIAGYKDLSKTPMQKYFSTGRYKELNDPELESYWMVVKKAELRWNLFVIALIIIFYLISY